MEAWRIIVGHERGARKMLLRSLLIPRISESYTGWYVALLTVIKGNKPGLESIGGVARQQDGASPHKGKGTEVEERLKRGRKEEKGRFGVQPTRSPTPNVDDDREFFLS